MTNSPLTIAARALVDYYLGQTDTADSIDWDILDDLVRNLDTALEASDHAN